MKRLVLALFVVLSGCNFNLLTIEFESREVCMSDMRAPFPGGADGTVTATLTRGEGQGEGVGAFDLDLPEGFEVTDVTLLGIGLTPVTGIEDLHFIDLFQLSMTATDGYLALPDITLIDLPNGMPYDRYNSTTGGPAFLPSESRVNLIDYLAAEELSFVLDIEGEMPEDEWSLDLGICFTFVAEYEREL